jgi:hypothetical protein
MSTILNPDAFTRKTLKTIISESHEQASILARKHYEQYGRGAEHIIAGGKPGFVALEDLRGQEFPGVDDALDRVETYDPAVEMVAIWEPNAEQQRRAREKMRQEHEDLVLPEVDGQPDPVSVTYPLAPSVKEMIGTGEQG